MTGQLVFDLPVRRAEGRGDFFVSGCNARAVALIDKWPDWDMAAQCLVGPPRCGKSHLSGVLLSQAGGHMVNGEELATHAIAEAVEAWLSQLGGNNGADAIMIVDRLENLPPQGEETLFHMINHAHNSGSKLLLVSHRSPAHLDIELPDLASRLRALPVSDMGMPDDELVRGLLVKLFNDRQVVVGARVIEYLLPRIERDFNAIETLVADIDQRAMREQRGITVPLVAELV